MDMDIDVEKPKWLTQTEGILETLMNFVAIDLRRSRGLGIAAQDCLLVVKPLVECLHIFFGVRRKQVIDNYVGRRYQDRFGVRERIVAILSVVVPDARGSHSPVRHGLNEQRDIGLIYGAPAERKGLQDSIDRLLISAEHVAG